MKKIFALLLIITAVSFIFSSCHWFKKGEDEPCAHAESTVVTENELAATCTAGGSFDELTRCANCGEELSRVTKDVPALGHLASEVSFTDDYCGNDPVATLECSRCGLNMGKFGHNYVKTVTQPTCTKDGEEKYTCSKCSDSYTERIPSQGHITSSWETLTAPTCNHEGRAVKVCLVCGMEGEAKSIEKLPHHYTSELSGDNLVYTCLECSHSYSTAVSTPTYDLTFIENGGEEVKDVTVLEHEIPSLPVTLREGYVFLGWYYDEELTEPYTDAQISEDITLYAAWDKLESISDEEDIVKGAPLDFVFYITSDKALTDSTLSSAVTVKTLGGDDVRAYIVSSEAGVYGIGCDYEAGENYFVTVTGAVIQGKEANTLWIKTEGEKKNDIVLKDGVLSFSSEELFGIYENGDGDGIILIAYDDILSVGDVAAFYEGDSDAYRIGVKILSESSLKGYTSYTAEIVEIDELFEVCNLSESERVDFNNADINKNLAEEVSAAFKQSDVYHQYLSAVQTVASSYGGSLGPVDFEANFFSKGDVFTIKLTASAELDSGATFIMEYYIDLEFEIDFALAGENSSVILTTDMTNTVQLNVIFDGEEMHGTASLTRNALLREYRKVFNEIKERNLKLSPSDENGAMNPTAYHLATIPVQIGPATAYVKLSGEFDFAMMGGLSAELVHNVKAVIGFKGEELVKDHKAKLVSLSGVAYAGIDVYGGVGVSLEVGYCGLYAYIDGTIGLRGELIGSCALALTEKKSFVLGTYNFDSQVIMTMNVGAKYHLSLFGFEKTLFDTSMQVAEVGFPFITLGDEVLALHFIDESYESTRSPLALGSVSCGTIDLTKEIDTSVLVLDVNSFKPVGTNLTCEYNAKVVSGNVKARITKNGVMTLTGEGSFTISVTVQYGDVIEKTLFVTGNASHKYDKKVENGNTFRTEATCYKKSTYYYSCSSCNKISPDKYYEAGDMKPHNLGEYLTNASSHWQKCTNVGCDHTTAKVEHTFVEKVEDKYLVSLGNCESLSVYHLSCKVCAVTGSDTFQYGEIKPHEYADIFTCHDRKCLNCSHIEKKSTDHYDFKDGYCECGFPTITSGLVFTLHGNSYTVTNYTGIETSVVIPKTYNGKPVTAIGHYAFENCSSLTSITIPDSVTNIEGYAFYSCDSLKAVYITDIAKWCAISFGNYCSNPLGRNLYLNGELVTELVIPDGVTSIGNYAFQGCTSLTSITIPDSVTSIGDLAFFGCDSLTSVTIGDGVKYIGNEAFYDCSSLTSITIPDSVTSIGDYAFSGCKSLTSIRYKGTKAQWWYAISKGSYWNSDTGSYTIYCTDGEI